MAIGTNKTGMARQPRIVDQGLVVLTALLAEHRHESSQGRSGHDEGEADQHLAATDDLLGSGHDARCRRLVIR